MNPEREALLLSRIVDRMADDTDFDQIGRIASEDPGVWERLGLTLRDDGPGYSLLRYIRRGKVTAIVGDY